MSLTLVHQDEGEKGNTLNKRLRITYDGKVIYDDTPESITFTESGQEISLKAGPQGPGLIEQLTAAAKRKQQQQQQPMLATGPT